MFSGKRNLNRATSKQKAKLRAAWVLQNFTNSFKILTARRTALLATNVYNSLAVHLFRALRHFEELKKMLNFKKSFWFEEMLNKTVEEMYRENQYN